MGIVGGPWRESPRTQTGSECLGHTKNLCGHNRIEENPVSFM